MVNYYHNLSNLVFVKGSQRYIEKGGSVNKYTGSHDGKKLSMKISIFLHLPVLMCYIVIEKKLLIL